MTTLTEKLAQATREWRKAGFPHDEYTAIAEILGWAADPEGAVFRLRLPQLRALEVYWFLRVVERTPQISDLYSKYFPAEQDTSALLSALGISEKAFTASNYQFSLLWKNIATNDAFVREHGLQALRETLNLE